MPSTGQIPRRVREPSPDQREEIKREGEALTEHLEGPSRVATRKAIYAKAKRWIVSQVANTG